MLAARAYLELVQHLLAEFARPTSDGRSIALIRAQHIAVVVTLRSIGYVLIKVDADTPTKVAWLKEQWKTWKTEPIFADFIEPGRNSLVKEARGLLDLQDPAVSLSAIVTDPGMPGQVSYLVSFEPAALRTGDRPTLELFHEALRFWETRVTQTERAFSEPG